MENAHFSHFGLKPEDGNVERTNQARIDGYSFGDRLLEGVMFNVTIQEDGSLSVEVDPAHAAYFNQLNTEMWLERALEEAKTRDVFEPGDIGLIMDDGRYNHEWEDDERGGPRQPIVIQMTRPGNLFDR